MNRKAKGQKPGALCRSQLEHGAGMEPDGVCGYFVVEPRTLNPASQVHDLETQKRFKCPLVAGTERSNLLELDEGVFTFLVRA